MSELTPLLAARPQPELFTLHASGLDAGALPPGRLTRALHLALGALGFSADSVGAVIPERPGLFLVAISRDVATRIHTPMALPLPPSGPGRPAATAELRRPGDPHGMAPIRATLRWDDGGPPPTVGALSRALDGADGLRLFGDELGAILPSGDGLLLSFAPASLPSWAERNLDVNGRAMRLTAVPTP
jgi:hypothetical protein